jgi:hypothetical protein
VKSHSYGWLLLGSLALGVCCAKGSSGEPSSGSGGSGGSSQPSTGDAGHASNGGSGPSTNSNGGSTSMSTTEMGGSPATGGSGPSGSSSSGVSCTHPQHLCSGSCVGNTPDNGCFTSASCTACTPPDHGTSSCNAAGACDFTCTAPYMKSGSQCTCPSCCTNNNQCQNGFTCDTSSGKCSCDNGTCFTYCLSMQQGGACLLGACTCT